MLFFDGKLEQDEFLPPVNTPIIRSVSADMITNLVTITQLARGGH